jgi:hypothetical protein
VTTANRFGSVVPVGLRLKRATNARNTATSERRTTGRTKAFEMAIAANALHSPLHAG